MKRIKWENIFLLLILPLSIITIIYHFKLNGLNVNLIIESLIYLGLPVIIRDEIKEIRKGE